MVLCLLVVDSVDVGRGVVVVCLVVYWVVGVVCFVVVVGCVVGNVMVLCLLVVDSVVVGRGVESLKLIVLDDSVFVY